MGVPVRWVLALLVGLHAAAALVALVTTDWSLPSFIAGDSLQYKALAELPGVPYRDFEVAFPPLVLGYLEVVQRPDDPTVAAWLLVLTQLACDLAVAAALAYGWTARHAVAWLALMLPLCWGGWIFARLDLLSAALALWGLALARRGREGPGGVALSLGAFAKAWPLLTLPGLWIDQRRRALATALVALVIGGLAWLAVGGFSGVMQVATFRGAEGYQVESSVGSVLLLNPSHPVFDEAGALRVGMQPGWAKVATALALAGGVVATWALAWRASSGLRRHQAERASELGWLVSVGLLLVLSPLLSPQFLVWLVPFVALRWRDRALVAVTAAATVLTALVASDYSALLDDGRTGVARLAVARNALLVAIVVIGVIRLLELVAQPISAAGAVGTARRTRR